jgi:hypothetical protein
MRRGSAPPYAEKSADEEIRPAEEEWTETESPDESPDQPEVSESEEEAELGEEVPGEEEFEYYGEAPTPLLGTDNYPIVKVNKKVLKGVEFQYSGKKGEPIHRGDVILRNIIFKFCGAKSATLPNDRSGYERERLRIQMQGRNMLCNSFYAETPESVDLIDARASTVYVKIPETLVMFVSPLLFYEQSGLPMWIFDPHAVNWKDVTRVGGLAFSSTRRNGRFNERPFDERAPWFTHLHMPNLKDTLYGAMAFYHVEKLTFGDGIKLIGQSWGMPNLRRIKVCGGSLRTRGNEREAGRLVGFNQTKMLRGPAIDFGRIGFAESATATTIEECEDSFQEVESCAATLPLPPP